MLLPLTAKWPSAKDIQGFPVFHAMAVSESEFIHIVHCVNNYDRLVEALKLSMLGLEAMIEDGRCGDTFTATALHLDKCNALLAQLDTKGEE